MVSTIGRQQGRWSYALILSAALVSGCANRSWNPFRVVAPPPPAESFVLRGDQLEPEYAATDNKAIKELQGAHELFRRGDYAKAESVFHRIADDKKNSPAIAEEARFYEAESLRWQKCYPKAADTYNRLLKDFPQGTHRDQCVQHMYQIANIWLDDTRDEMREYQEIKQGKRTFRSWRSPFHLDKHKPFLDEEGRALEKLEQVKYNDITGPMADRALFLAGSVKFFREDYLEADHLFSQLVDWHPNSPYAPKAIELGIISKHMSTGGSDYDGRKVAEARRMIDVALRSYPELAAKKSEFLERQMAGINFQQAEKDFKIAEFYRRTGHPGAAYFYYEIVKRRYPNSKFAEKSDERMCELRKKAIKKGKPIETLTSGPPAEKAPMPKKVTDPDQPETAPAPKKLPDEIPETAPMPKKAS